MPARRKGRRVLGPYEAHGKWRVIVVEEDGTRTPKLFSTEAEAEEVAEEARRELAEATATIEQALTEYEAFLRDKSKGKGNEEVSVVNTLYRLRKFFPPGLVTAEGQEVEGYLGRDEDLRTLTPKVCAGLYVALVESKRKTRAGLVPLSVAFHRNTLAEAKTFLRWCVAQRYLSEMPLEHVRGMGRRKKGKFQYGIDHARSWYAKALELADEGDEGAVAALMALLMGMRASEIVKTRAGFIDARGTVLRIPDAKTAEGVRNLEVPMVLRPIIAEMAAGLRPGDLLLGHHWRDFPREAAQRIAKLAKVPPITAHGLRGLVASTSVRRGVSGDMVAEYLGHRSFEETTAQAYVTKDALAAGRQRAVLELLEGGKKAS